MLEATKKSRQLSLKRYLRTFQQFRHEEYEKKDREMPDCTICLESYVPSDLLIVFTCDEKHYFHKECGYEWLQVKTECPLCRYDFENEINNFIKYRSNDIIQEVARETALEGSTYGQNGRAHDTSIQRMNQEQVNVDELVRELTQSMNELHNRMNNDSRDMAAE